MGYDTKFAGKFELDRQLDLNTHNFLVKFNETRRVARNVDPKYGVEGEFYVDGGGEFGQGHESDIINYNRPPLGQPSLWCQWRPTDDGLAIEWDQSEKFYKYVEWLQYIIDHILFPRNYVLNGTVRWYGEKPKDNGAITVKNNTVTAREF